MSSDPNKIPISQRSSISSQRSSSSGMTRSPSSAEFVNFMGAAGGDQPAQVNNRVETIRQYYHQLTSNIRLIQQQLQQADLPPARRQALLVEQARANAAMQDFTEKILKPITAQKAAQQQQQMAAAAQQHGMQNQPSFQRPPPPQGSMYNSQQYQQYQQQQQQQQYQQQYQQQQRYPIPQSQPSQPWNPQSRPQTALHSAQKQMSVPVGNRPPQGQAPPPNAINLNSQMGIGMIRPIMNTQNTSASIPPSPNRYRPQLASTISSISANPSLPPTTPTKAQQMLINRQSYLQAAQQHQTTVRQQQSTFQQRLLLFSRDVQSTRLQKRRAKAPTLALSTPSHLKSSTGAGSHPSSPSRRSDSPMRAGKSGTNVMYPAAANALLSSAKTSSLPANHSSTTLARLARMVNPRIQLQSKAQQKLLSMADIFTDVLVRQACQLAEHRAGGKGAPQLTVEDVQLALDLTLNYQPAGQGSIENCRPPKKPQTAGLLTNTATTNSDNVPSSSGSLAHHHRMTVIKKHAAIFSVHQGRVNETNEM